MVVEKEKKRNVIFFPQQGLKIDLCKGGGEEVGVVLGAEQIWVL